MPKNGMNREEIQIKSRNILLLVEKYLGEQVKLISCAVEDEHEERPIKSMWTALEQIITADCVVFSEGYKDIRSCKLEYAFASEYDKQILLERDGKIIEVD